MLITNDELEENLSLNFSRCGFIDEALLNNLNTPFGIKMMFN